MNTMSGMLAAIANTRELAPVVVAIALAAKVGTGFTAQIGAMRISDEIDALDTMGIQSVPFPVGTRVLAALVCASSYLHDRAIGQPSVHPHRRGVLQRRVGGHL